LGKKTLKKKAHPEDPDKGFCIFLFFNPDRHVVQRLKWDPTEKTKPPPVFRPPKNSRNPQKLNL